MIKEKYINEFRELLLEKGETVGYVEITHGNYDNEGNLIDKGVPTITTDFCEIGAYDNIVYFTFVLHSDTYSKELFDLLKDFSNVQIYGFKDFKTILYPRTNFDYKDFEKSIREEKYFQIQFNYNFQKETPELLYKEYSKVRDILSGSNVKTVNQLKVDLIKESKNL